MKSSDMWSWPATTDPVLEKLDLSAPLRPMSEEERRAWKEEYDRELEEALRPFRTIRRRQCRCCGR